ncbi:winged helix-turn-helix domain-containing protein [Granulicella sp. S156]|uniref:winged helix-turn-helix domain-containing protein n=1 Tax=Granulicella sp. S156 TaxID=1747224 RepID=UPI00131C8EDB|nr:winged helix-turn-helix domain-containing protein [Granulicella sp. S156]
MLDFPRTEESTGLHGAKTIRFGEFEAELQTGQLWKSGSRVKLQDQPFRVLQVLLQRPGTLVTREELQSQIWPEENFGDFDHAVNVAVAKLRTALGDSAENPSFIETVPRRGYRFIAEVEDSPEDPLLAKTDVSAAGTPFRPNKVLLVLLAVIVVGSLVGVGVLLGSGGGRSQPPDFQRLTSRHGTVYAARFAPDGHSVIYSASWDGAPIEMYSTDLNSNGVRSLGFSATDLLAVSSSGQMAVLQSAKPRFLWAVRGTLGQMPLAGGAPRQIAENVEWADWAPDGKSIAIVRNMAGKQRLEFPVGHVLYETVGWITHVRVSPKGDQIAFLDHPRYHDDEGVVSMVDLAGNRKVLSTGWESEEGLAWAPDGKEVWFTATQSGLQRRVYAVSLSGKLRQAFHALGGVTLQDIAPDGRVLLTHDEQRSGIMGLAPGATRERDLSWLDWSIPVALSADGNLLLFDEQGQQTGSTYTVATRDLKGSAPIALGEGMAGDLSPDGKWAVSIVSYTQLMLLPTGPGTAQRIERGDIQQYGHSVHWMPDGKQIVFSGNQADHEARCFLQNIGDDKDRPLTPEGISSCTVSADGKLIVGSDPDGNEAALYPIDGGASRPIPGLLAGESYAWTSDPHFLYVYQPNQLPMKLYRLNVENGQRQLFREMTKDEVGVCDFSHLYLSADGRSYIYGYSRLLSDLYLVNGLK